MGLELTEIILAVEDQFGIEIKEDDLEKIQTVGALHSYVIEKLAGMPSSGCHTLESFLKLRTAIALATNLPKSAITLETRLDSILPWSHRRSLWRRIQKAVPRLPGLELQPFVANTLLVACIAAAIFFGFRTARNAYLDDGNAIFDVAFVFLFSTVFVAISLCMFMYIATRPLARTIPRTHATPRDVLLSLYPRQSDDDGALGQKDEIWNALVSIIAGVLSRPVASIHPEDRFVEDLDAG